MHTQRGYIFFIVIVFLQIFSLVSLYSLEEIRNNIKSSAHYWQGYQYRLLVKNELQQLEMRIIQSASCVISHVSAIDLKKRSLTWWQANTCHDIVNGIRYYYAVEALDEDECAIAETSGNQSSLIAQYFRISLLALPHKLKGAGYLLQSTVVKPVVSAKVCSGQTHHVTAGRQMWRELG